MNSRFFNYHIDIVGTCNLRCISCPQANYREKKRTNGLMDLRLFENIVKKILLENPGLQNIYLYNWTEPFLHPNLPEFIKIVKKYGINCSLSSHFNQIKNLSAVIKAKPDYLRISVSGFSQENYEKNHQRGNIEEVKKNLIYLRELLDHLGSKTFVQIAYLIFKYNLAEDLNKMMEFAKKLNFSFSREIAYLNPLEKNFQYLQNELPEKDQDLLEQFILKPDQAIQLNKKFSTKYQRPDCILRSQDMAINFDGSVALCCTVYEQQNDIAKNFLDKSHKELQKNKYEHPLCQKCLKIGVNQIFSTNLLQLIINSNSLTD